MKYSISDIARLLGISIVAVRNYEKCGLIDPERNEQNNYRQYNAIDLNLIRRARSYMSYGFSLNEATDLLRSEALPGMAKALKEKEKDIESQLMRDYQMLQFVRQHAAYLERVSVSEGECMLEMSPAVYGIVYRERLQMFEDPCLHHKVRVWNDIRPFAETLLAFKEDSFANGENCYQSGLCIEERYAELFGVKEDEHVRYFPARKSVHTILSCTYEPDQDFNEFRFEYVLKWMEERNLKCAGDIFGRVLHTSKSTGNWLHHAEIWVPIE